MKKVVVLSLMGALLVGCGAGGRSLAGKWNMNMPADAGLPPGSKATMEFKGGDAFAMKIDVNSPSPQGKPMKMTMDYSGTYKLSAEQLELKFTDFALKADDPKVQSMLDASLGANKKDMLAKMNESTSGSIKWVDNDNVTIKSTGGKDLTLTRAK